MYGRTGQRRVIFSPVAILRAADLRTIAIGEGRFDPSLHRGYVIDNSSVEAAALEPAGILVSRVPKHTRLDVGSRPAIVVTVNAQNIDETHTIFLLICGKLREQPGIVVHIAVGGVIGACADSTSLVF